MTLPTEGEMSIGPSGNINAEFGLPGDAVFPDDFYGLGGAPASGPLSFFDFYGRSSVIWDPPGDFATASGLTDASITISASKSVTWTYSHVGGVSSSVSLPSGGTGFSITFTSTAPDSVSEYNLHAEVDGASHDWFVGLTVGTPP